MFLVPPIILRTDLRLKHLCYIQMRLMLMSRWGINASVGRKGQRSKPDSITLDTMGQFLQVQYWRKKKP